MNNRQMTYDALIDMKHGDAFIVNRRYFCIIRSCSIGEKCFSAAAKDFNSPRVSAIAYASVIDNDTSKVAEGMIELFDDVDLKNGKGASLSLRYDNNANSWQSNQLIAEVELKVK